MCGLCQNWGLNRLLYRVHSLPCLVMDKLPVTTLAETWLLWPRRVNCQSFHMDLLRCEMDFSKWWVYLSPFTKRNQVEVWLRLIKFKDLTPWVRFAFGNVFLDIYHILVFSSLLLLANVSHKVVKDRLEPDKTTREVLLQKNFSTTWEGRRKLLSAGILRQRWKSPHWKWEHTGFASFERMESKKDEKERI